MNPPPNERGIRLAHFRPGHVFWMPRGATWLNRDKPRPFVLATNCGAGTLGTLIYGSTQLTESHAGAACVYVNPRPGGVNRNGLRERTAFYPGILIRDRYEQLPAHAGTVGSSLEALRTALRTAPGIGTGSCLTPGAAVGSRRGRIVQLEHKLAGAMRTPFAVLLTQPRYSRARHYHLILPLVPDYGAVTGPEVLRLSGMEWMTVFARPPRAVLLPIPLVHSIWYSLAVVRETAYVVDDQSLAEIDQRLCGYFSLPPAGDEEKPR